jgi:hypothetical protein
MHLAATILSPAQTKLVAAEAECARGAKTLIRVVGRTTSGNLAPGPRERESSVHKTPLSPHLNVNIHTFTPYGLCKRSLQHSHTDLTRARIRKRRMANCFNQLVRGD